MKLSELFLSEDENGKKFGEDDGTGLIEVAEVLKDRNPAMAMKYLRALWGKPRLAYHGKPFFGSGDTVYDDVNAALERAIKSGLEVPVSIPVGGTDELDMDELTYNAQIADFQEVYLGYSSKNDKLYVGIDAWLNEEDFNEAWDREFENNTGEKYDEENEEHHAMFMNAWNEFKDMGFYGILFELSGNPIDDAEEISSVPEGFYKGIYRGNTLKNMGLVDLRLD